MCAHAKFYMSDARVYHAYLFIWVAFYPHMHIKVVATWYNIFFGFKTILGVECVYPEECVSFGMVL